jgi:hypothetical protein
MLKAEGNKLHAAGGWGCGAAQGSCTRACDMLASGSHGTTPCVLHDLT